MKCVLLLLAFVAVCYSYPYYAGRSVNISEDGTIVITGTNGKRIVISKGTGISGQKTVDIFVSGPNIPTKSIQINDQNQVRLQGESNDLTDENLRDKRSSKDSKKRSQGDILTKIISGYQGDVDQTSYQKLLNEINVAVQEGKLNSSIYDVLQSLNQEQEVVLGSQGVPVNIVDLLREQAIQQELERLQQEQQIRQVLQGQQVLPEQKSQIWNTLATQQGTPVIQRMLLQNPQTVVPLKVTVSGIRGIGVPEQQGLGGMTGLEGRTIGVRNLLTSRPLGVSQGIQQLEPLGQTIINKLSQVNQQERNVLGDQQQQIPLQQLQQQRQLLEQQLLQQQLLGQQVGQQQLLQPWQQQQLEQQNGQQQLIQPWQQQQQLGQPIGQQQLLQPWLQQQQLQQQSGQQQLVQPWQLQQQLEQQIGQQQLLQPWQQQQRLVQQSGQQQLLQLLQQQQQLDQLRNQQQLVQPQQWQPQMWGQQNNQLQVSQALTLRDLLNSGKPVITTRGQQNLWQQQPGVYSQEGLYGGIGQGLPRIQRIPVVL